jgi:4-hydroxy-3-methylbut-2-enyl diphosphate reductase
MLGLNVQIDKDSGFCFGVIYAVEMAEEILDEEKKLYCLGDIVHNDEEIARLHSKGLVIISHDELKQLKNCKVLIRAHGEPSSTYQIALENNIELIDASCPVVLKLQNRIKNSFDKDENIYIYGKHGHAEIVGLKAQTNDKGIVFENFEEIDHTALPSKITLYSQTTKSTDAFYNIKQKLEQKGIEVDSNDTICRQVSNRDHDLKNFASLYDSIIFVSGKKSSNGKVLYNVCKQVNPNTYFVSKTEDIDSAWFKNQSTVGICGATSTPMWLMEKIKTYLTTL